MIKKLIATSVLTMGIAFIATPAMAAEPSSSDGGTVHVDNGGSGTVDITFTDNAAARTKILEHALNKAAENNKKEGKSNDLSDGEVALIGSRVASGGASHVSKTLNMISAEEADSSLDGAI